MDEHVAAADFVEEDAMGGASPPARPALDGSVPCSFLECGHAKADGGTLGP
jgi:hypothetical protein